MTSVVEAKREYFASLGIEQGAVVDMEAAYYEGLGGGTVTTVPAASETVSGTVKKADFVAVPASFADLAAVRTWAAALSAALVSAGQMSAS